MAAGEGPGAAQMSWIGVLGSLAEGLRVLSRAAAPLSARRAPSGCWERWVLRSARSARGRARRAGCSSRVGKARARCSPSELHRTRAAPDPRSTQTRAVIDSHTHLDLCEPPNTELVGRGGAGRGDAHPHGRHGQRLLPRGARGRGGVPAGVRGGRPPPQLRDRLRRRRPGGAACARRAPPLPGDRRDRARLLPRLRPRAPTRSARSPRRSSSRASWASRS